MAENNLEKALKVKLCDETLLTYMEELEDVLDVLPEIGVDTVGKLLQFTDILKAGNFAGFPTPKFIPILNLLNSKYLNITFDTDYLSESTASLCTASRDDGIYYKVFLPSLDELGFSEDEDEFLEDISEFHRNESKVGEQRFEHYLLEYIIKYGKYLKGDYPLEWVGEYPGAEINTYTIPLIEYLIKFDEEKKSDNDYHYDVGASVAEKIQLCLNCYGSLEKNQVNLDELTSLKKQLENAIENKDILDEQINNFNSQIERMECLASLNKSIKGSKIKK